MRLARTMRITCLIGVIVYLFSPYDLAARIWTNKDGRKIEGEVVKFTESGVMLRLVNGRTVEVNPIHLIEEDRAFLKSLREPQKKAMRISVKDVRYSKNVDGVSYLGVVTRIRPKGESKDFGFLEVDMIINKIEGDKSGYCRSGNFRVVVDVDGAVKSISPLGSPNRINEFIGRGSWLLTQDEDGKIRSTTIVVRSGFGDSFQQSYLYVLPPKAVVKGLQYPGDPLIPLTAQK